VVDEELTAVSRSNLYCVNSRTLGAYEEDLAVLCCYGAEVVERIIKHPDSSLEVDDVNAVAGSVDIGLHLRVPETGLMSEMDTCLKHVLH